MEKIKSLLSPGSSKDDEAMYNTPDKSETVGATGKVTGQGSHFGSSDTPTTETSTAPATSSTVPPTATTEAPTHGTPATATESSGSWPTTLREKEGPGQAAIGETSTYSSRPVGQADATSSVTDPNSSDPTAFKKPENFSTGVGSDAAVTAASTAFSRDKERETAGSMPGAFPSSGATNPYANQNIDPRVDSPGHRSAIQTSHTGRDAAIGGVGAGAAGTAAYEAFKPKEISSTTPTSTAAAPSTLSSTEDPTIRSGDKSGATGTKAPESSSHPSTMTAGPAATIGTSKSPEEPEHEKTSLKTKVLGTLGIGAAGVAAKEAKDRKASSGSAVESGIPSGQRPSHHRKESIPTTAYPSGTFDSPRATAPPVGGASLGGRHSSVDEINQQTRRDSRELQAAGAYSGGYAAYDNRGHTQAMRATQAPAEESHLGRDAAIGAGAVGATGLALHEHEKGHGTEPGHQGTGSTVHNMTTTGPSSSRTAGTTAAGTTGATTAAPMAGKEREDDSHLGRDATLGGAAVGGGGVLAEHESSKREAEKHMKAQEKEARKEAKHEAKEQRAAEKEAKKEEREYEKRENEAAAAGIGATAVGAGAYEAEKHHGGKDEETTKQRQKEQKEAEVLARQRQMRQDYEDRKAEVQHDQEQRIQARIAEEEEKRGSGHGKEAAAAGVGAGALGVGAYEAEKHHEGTAAASTTERGEATPGSTATATAPTTTSNEPRSITDSSTTDALADADASNREAYGKTSHRSTGTTAAETAGVAGVGSAAAAYEADKHGEHVEHVPKDHHLIDDETGRTVPSESGTGHGTSGLTGLAAADAADREAYGSKHDHNKLHKEPKEKKPGFFRRIFKRRKNKDTGDSEEYSSEEEYDGNDHHGHHGTEAAVGTGAAGTAAATEAKHHHGIGRETGTMPETDNAGYSVGGSSVGPTTNEEGTFNRPSYNPFTRDQKIKDQVHHGTTVGQHEGITDQNVDTKTGAPVE